MSDFWRSSLVWTVFLKDKKYWLNCSWFYQGNGNLPHYGSHWILCFPDAALVVVVKWRVYVAKSGAAVAEKGQEAERNLGTKSHGFNFYVLVQSVNVVMAADPWKPLYTMMLHSSWQILLIWEWYCRQIYVLVSLPCLHFRVFRAFFFCFDTIFKLTLDTEQINLSNTFAK